MREYFRNLYAQALGLLSGRRMGDPEEMELAASRKLHLLYDNLQRLDKDGFILRQDELSQIVAEVKQEVELEFFEKGGCFDPYREVARDAMEKLSHAFSKAPAVW